MGRTKFQVDKVLVEDIPEFSGIFAAYGHLVPDLRGMLAYLCYRFDPNCEEVRNSKGVEEKGRMASMLSEWTPPEAVAVDSADGDDDESPLYSAEWQIYMDVVGEYFLQAADDTMEYLESLDIMMSNSNKVMRMPIDGNPGVMTKTLLNVQKASEGVMTARDSKAQVLKEMVDEEAAHKRAIMAKVKQKRAQTSPEGSKR